MQSRLANAGGPARTIGAGERPATTAGFWHNANFYMKHYLSAVSRRARRTHQTIALRLAVHISAVADKLDVLGPLPEDIIVRSLIRQAWTRYRWDSRPARRP
jgi:hypothetical protein